MARRFHFRLQTLMRVRELKEREAQRGVAAHVAELVELDELDAIARRDIHDVHTQLLRTQQSDTPETADLTRGRAWIAQQQRQIIEREMQRKTVQQQLAVAQQKLREARTQTRILEKLRERRLEQHLQAAKRRERLVEAEVARQMYLRRALESVSADADLGSHTQVHGD